MLLIKQNRLIFETVIVLNVVELLYLCFLGEGHISTARAVESTMSDRNVGK